MRYFLISSLERRREEREKSNEAARDLWRAPMLTRCATGTVYPGDTVTLSFAATTGTTWLQTWSVAPGAIGKAAGAKATSGTYTFTFRSYSSPCLVLNI